MARRGRRGEKRNDKHTSKLIFFFHFPLTQRYHGERLTHVHTLKERATMAPAAKEFYEDQKNLNKLCNFLRSADGPAVREAIMMDKRVYYIKGKFKIFVIFAHNPLFVRSRLIYPSPSANGFYYFPSLLFSMCTQERSL